MRWSGLVNEKKFAHMAATRKIGGLCLRSLSEVKNKKE